MEWIRDIIKVFYPLLIAVSCTLFVVGIFFAAETRDGMGVFERSATVWEPAMDAGEIRNESLSFVKEEVSAYVPLVKYAGGVRAFGEVLVFQELFQVQKEDGSWTCGSAESDFAIYLMDIRNRQGNSVMVRMTEDELLEQEGCLTKFVYEKEQDLLYCFTEGIYIMCIKIYAANGGMAVYEFRFPVGVC